MHDRINVRFDYKYLRANGSPQAIQYLLKMKPQSCMPVTVYRVKAGLVAVVVGHKKRQTAGPNWLGSGSLQLLEDNKVRIAITASASDNAGRMEELITQRLALALSYARDRKQSTEPQKELFFA